MQAGARRKHILGWRAASVPAANLRTEQACSDVGRTWLIDDGHGVGDLDPLAGDAAALAADYAEHAVIESPTAGTHTGPEAAERTFRVIFSAFLDLTTKVEDRIIDGNNAVTVVSIEGTHIGEFLGLPPTGKRFIMPIVFFYQLENGKIVRERRIFDFTGLLVQIGVLKAKPA